MKTAVIIYVINNFLKSIKKITFLYLVIFTVYVSCQNDKNNAVNLIVSLPQNLSEVSGMVATDSIIWMIEDSGNKSKIYGIKYDGMVEHTIKLDDIPNIDWEDLTRDNNNLYIGDFGNNDNDRKDLAIYKISPNNPSLPVEKINFNYPEQTHFPAKKKEKLYDCEAFFIYQNAFYLFTKNRSKGFDGTTLIYKIPAIVGNHSAQLIGKFKTCANYNSCVITGAAISPDEKKIVLLGHKNIWLFEEFNDDDFLSGKITELALNHYSQKEAVSFKDNDKLLIADERTKKRGGNLYEVSIHTLKSTH
ncbi:MAG TPA: hypothetical protein PLL09_11590 [Flavobacterium sp.]|uniref:hypothetical protein n=1 Tax=unclassified Flavobacterium TaxID=196869 RepID=UPI0025C55273|nr:MULTISPECIES: hypothetical protein [unclassified Flavobacterium]HRE78452.1 hypothetical protein [Flavobacterium sp.]